MDIIRKENAKNTYVEVNGVKTEHINYIKYYRNDDIKVIDLKNCDGSMGGVFSEQLAMYIAEHPERTEKIINWVNKVSSHPEKLFMRILKDLAWEHYYLNKKVTEFNSALSALDAIREL